MNAANHVPEEDLALLALELLTPDEAARMLSHIRECDLCRTEVARLRGDLAAYAMTAEMHDPPVSAKARLLEAVAMEHRLPLGAAVTGPLRTPRAAETTKRKSEEEPQRRGMGWFGWLGWAAAAGLAAATFLELQQARDLREQLRSQGAQLAQTQQPSENAAEVARAQQVLHTLTDPSAMQVALHLPSTPGVAPKPEGHAAYVAGTGDLVFVASHLRPIAPNKAYELWLLPAGGRAPIPAGVFRPDQNGNASVVLPDIPKNIAAKGFGVTIENEGGSVKPTPPIVLAGTQG